MWGQKLHCMRGSSWRMLQLRTEGIPFRGDDRVAAEHCRFSCHGSSDFVYSFPEAVTDVAGTTHKAEGKDFGAEGLGDAVLLCGFTRCTNLRTEDRWQSLTHCFPTHHRLPDTAAGASEGSPGHG